ncbi:DUF5343 domain-containing protein [Nitratireductor alexandrii]|uniref:DUF5343 domain-containing protein n=1 Tax=Nitratireductor alexandrii TaxID=2448161 RepID=UPI003B84AD52
MSLLNQSVQVYGQIPKFLETLRSGTAPSTFSRQFLKDIGFKSSNHHQFIPLLKGDLYTCVTRYSPVWRNIRSGVIPYSESRRPRSRRANGTIPSKSPAIP